MSQFPEKRISPRKSIRTRVVLEDEFGEGFFYFLSTDVSLSGIFIESPLKLQPKTKVFLKFSLFEGDEPLSLVGEVARVVGGMPGRDAIHRVSKQSKKGIGIRFVGLSPEELKKIEGFLKN